MQTTNTVQCICVKTARTAELVHPLERNIVPSLDPNRQSGTLHSGDSIVVGEVFTERLHLNNANNQVASPHSFSEPHSTRLPDAAHNCYVFASHLKTDVKQAVQPYRKNGLGRDDTVFRLNTI